LESHKYLHFKEQYLYGDLLQKADEQFEESVLVFLEMLKVFFPAGLKFDHTFLPQSHFEVFEQIKQKQGDKVEQEESSLLLLSRVFSLYPFKQQESMHVDSIDIDLSVFLTYA